MYQKNNLFPEYIHKSSLSHFSRVWLCATPWTAGHQAPPSLGFSRQEHWSGLPFPSPVHESEKWKWSHSVVSDAATPWTAAYQASPSLGFSRQEHWSGVPLPSSRNTWSNRQIWPWNTEWSRAKTNRVLPRKCTGHSKHPLPTTQEKTLHMDITRWSTPKSDWLYSLQPKMEKLYTVNKNKTRSWWWLRSWNPYCQTQT